MEGNGPIQGTPKPVGVLVTGSDLAAVDATCCRIMKINPSSIRYLRLAAGPDHLDEENIRQIGEHIKSVQTPFELLHNSRPFAYEHGRNRRYRVRGRGLGEPARCASCSARVPRSDGDPRLSDLRVGSGAVLLAIAYSGGRSFESPL